MISILFVTVGVLATPVLGAIPPPPPDRPLRVTVFDTPDGKGADPCQPMWEVVLERRDVPELVFTRLLVHGTCEAPEMPITRRFAVVNDSPAGGCGARVIDGKASDGSLLRFSDLSKVTCDVVVRHGFTVELTVGAKKTTYHSEPTVR